MALISWDGGVCNEGVFFGDMLWTPSLYCSRSFPSMALTWCNAVCVTSRCHNMSQTVYSFKAKHHQQPWRHTPASNFKKTNSKSISLLVFWQTFKILSCLCPTVPVISSHTCCTRAPGVFRWCKAVALAIAAERRLPQCPKKTSGVWHNRERINSHPETTKRSVTFTQTENVSKWEEYWHSCEVHCCFSTVSEDYSIWDKPFKIQSLFMLRSWILLCGERTFQNSSNFFACYYHSKSIVDVECEHVYPYVPSLRPGTDCSNHDSRSLVIQQL